MRSGVEERRMRKSTEKIKNEKQKMRRGIRRWQEEEKRNGKYAVQYGNEKTKLPFSYSLCEWGLEEICKQYYAICFILQEWEQSSRQVQ